MPMAAQEIARYRELLLDKREALLGQVENLVKDVASATESTSSSKSPLNIAENAADSYEQDFAFMSMESEEDLLRKVETALRNIHEGTYGSCAECGHEIASERLEAMPFADLCVGCQEKAERGQRQGGDGDEFEFLEDGETPAGDDLD